MDFVGEVVEQVAIVYQSFEDLVEYLFFGLYPDTPNEHLIKKHD